MTAITVRPYQAERGVGDRVVDRRWWPARYPGGRARGHHGAALVSDQIAHVELPLLSPVPVSPSVHPARLRPPARGEIVPTITRFESAGRINGLDRLR